MWCCLRQDDHWGRGTIPRWWWPCTLLLNLWKCSPRGLFTPSSEWLSFLSAGDVMLSTVKIFFSLQKVQQCCYFSTKIILAVVNFESSSLNFHRGLFGTRCVKNVTPRKYSAHSSQDDDWGLQGQQLQLCHICLRGFYVLAHVRCALWPTLTVSGTLVWSCTHAKYA